MIAADDVSFAYGARPVLDGVSLRADTGQVVAVVGSSGCGKTTLLRLLAGLARPASGRVEGGPAALLPQGDALLPWRTALGNAVTAARVAGEDGARARERAVALFDRFGLAGVEEEYPHRLSGGMRRRVSLLRTFLAERPVLLLDEPFGALDAVTRADLLDWLRDALAELPRAVVLVTHDVDEAADLADLVVVLRGRPARVHAALERPAREAVLDALGADGA